MSLYEPLCRELDIQVSELLSGKRLDDSEKIKQGEKSALGILVSKKQLKSFGFFAEILILVGIVTAITLTASAVTTTRPISGTGSSSDPYLITNKAELYWFANQVNSGSNSLCAKLGNDITVNSNVLDSNGELGSGTYDLWTPIAGTGDGYRGNFDGNGKTISGIVIQNPSEDYQGFFGKVYSGTVSTLKLVDSYIEGHDSVGGICGYSYSGGINAYF